MSQIARTRYIVTGPDGSGKSTFIMSITSNHLDIPVCYLGKRRNSSIVFNTASVLRTHASNIPFFSFVTRMLFFVIELIDLWAINLKSQKHFYLIERHFFDRIAYLFQLKLSAKRSLKRRVRLIVEWPILTILNLFYFLLFAKQSTIRVMLASPDRLYERKSNDYSSLSEAKLRRDAYLQAINWWVSKGGSCKILLNNSEENLGELLNEEAKIIRNLKNEFYR